MKRDVLYRTIGICMLIYYFIIINYVDFRFFEYFSMFSFLMISFAFICALKSDFLNHLVLFYFLVGIYLLGLQTIWIIQHGIHTSFTYQNPNIPGFPFWIHVINHSLPIPLAAILIFHKKPKVNWFYHAIWAVIMVVWSYTMDGERFLNISIFNTAYPLGIPITTAFLFIYQKWLRPKLLKATT